jgi:5'-3' exonuclease
MSKTFEKLTEQQNTLLIVDSLNLAFRYKHTGATDFAEDYLRTVLSLQKSYKASHVIIAGDQGSSSYRKAIYPEYKQNRKDKFAEQTDAEKAAFELFFEDFTKTLEHIQENT